MSAGFPDDPDFAGGESGSPALPAFLLDPRGVVERRWRWMVLALVLGLAATVAVTYSIQLRYQAEASVLITSQEIPQDFVRSTVRENTIANLNATVSQVLTTDNLARIIEQFDLYPKARGRVSNDQLAERIRRDIEINPERNVTKGSGSRGQTSIVYRLTFQSDSPTAAADVANALAALVVEASIAQRNEQARRITRFLKSALAEDERELREHSRQVSEFRRSHLGELPQELETNMRKLEMLHGQRVSLENQIAKSESRIVELRSRKHQADKTENELLLEKLRSELARQEALNTDEHPTVRSLRRRVASVEALVAAEGSGTSSGPGESLRLIQSEQRDIARMREQIATIDQDVANLSARIDRTPGVGEQLAALEQKEQVLREDYVGSLRKVEQAELAETLELAQQGAQVSILDRARPPSSPVRPRWLLLAAGVVASLGLALGAAVLLELIDPVVVSARQLEKLTDQPMLGSIPWVR